MLYKLEKLDKILASITIKKSIPILLYGEMGIGKTTLSKLIISKTLNIDQSKISSPTFNIINHYTCEKSNKDLYHCDLSRITDHNDELIEQILESIENNIYIIEWPNIIQKHLSQYISIKIDYFNKNTRNFLIERKK